MSQDNDISIGKNSTGGEATHKAPATPWRERTRNERGAVLALSTMFMTVLMGMMGFAVDIGNWYIHIQRAQRAADSASLAGDAHLPGNVTTARQAAYDQLIRNGVPVAEANQAMANAVCAGKNPCIAPVPGKKSQLEVRVITNVDNAFLGFLRLSKKNSFVRGSIADHKPSLMFGGLSNTLGTEVIADAADGPAWQDPSYAAFQSFYFLSVSGREAQKSQGDRYATWRCTGYTGSNGDAPPNLGSDLCTSGSTNGNAEYNSGGYWYTVSTKRGISGSYLGIEIYDAPFINVGGTGCGANNLTSYQRNQVRCSGDDTDGPDPPATNATTTYRVWSSDKSTLLCNHTFSGWNENVQTMLATNAQRGGDYFSSVFQRWYTLCYVPVSGARESTFYIEVTTGPENFNNHFALRSGIFSAQNRTARIDYDTKYLTKISVKDAFSMVNRYQGGTPVQFPLTRIPQAYAGETVTFELFDVGDNNISGGGGTAISGQMSIVSTGDLSTPVSRWGCQYQMPYSPRYVSPTTMSNCSVNVSRAGWNGKVARVNLQVPSDYTCNESDPMGCWTFVSMNFGANAQDVTTWTLREPGIPLRLIK